MMIFDCEIEGDKIGNKVVMGCDRGPKRSGSPADGDSCV